MLFAAGAILAAALVAEPQANVSPNVFPGAEVILGTGAAQRGAVEQPAPSPDPGERRHVFGVGGTMGVGVGGGGGTIRLFPTERLGVNAAIGYYRPGGVGSTSRGYAVMAAPSFVYMLTPANLDADIDLRPYVGGGVSYTSMSRPVQIGSTAATASQRTFGHQEFGGVELTFKDANDFTISAEVAHYRIRASGGFSPVLQGTNFHLMFHFFLR